MKIFHHKGAFRFLTGALIHSTGPVRPSSSPHETHRHQRRKKPIKSYRRVTKHEKELDIEKLNCFDMTLSNVVHKKRIKTR